MPKKGLAYNPTPARCPHPPDLRRFPEIQRLVTKEHAKRITVMRNSKARGANT